MVMTSPSTAPGNMPTPSLISHLAYLTPFICFGKWPICGSGDPGLISPRAPLRSLCLCCRRYHHCLPCLLSEEDVFWNHLECDVTIRSGRQMKSAPFLEM